MRTPTVTTDDVIRMAAMVGVRVQRGTVHTWASRGNIVRVRRGYDRASVIRWLTEERDHKQAERRSKDTGQTY